VRTDPHAEYLLNRKNNLCYTSGHGEKTLCECAIKHLTGAEKGRLIRGSLAMSLHDA
jgi:hypothetical protein